jgi:hypothetical protein
MEGQPLTRIVFQKFVSNASDVGENVIGPTYRNAPGRYVCATTMGQLFNTLFDQRRECTLPELASEDERGG